MILKDKFVTEIGHDPSGTKHSVCYAIEAMIESIDSMFSSSLDGDTWREYVKTGGMDTVGNVRGYYHYGTYFLNPGLYEVIYCLKHIFLYNTSNKAFAKFVEHRRGMGTVVRVRDENVNNVFNLGGHASFSEFMRSKLDKEPVITRLNGILDYNLDFGSVIQPGGAAITTRLQGNFSMLFSVLYDNGYISEDLFKKYKSIFKKPVWADFCKKVHNSFISERFEWKVVKGYFKKLGDGSLSRFGDHDSCFRPASKYNPACGELVDASDSFAVVTGEPVNKTSKFGGCRFILRRRTSGKINLFNFYFEEGKQQIDKTEIIRIFETPKVIDGRNTYMNKIIWMSQEVFCSEHPIDVDDSLGWLKNGNNVTCPFCNKETDTNSFVVRHVSFHHIFWCGRDDCDSKIWFDNARVPQEFPRQTIARIRRDRTSTEESSELVLCAACGQVCFDGPVRVFIDGETMETRCFCRNCASDEFAVAVCEECGHHTLRNGVNGSLVYIRDDRRLCAACFHENIEERRNT